MQSTLNLEEKEKLIDLLIGFIREIGLSVIVEPDASHSFLPGVRIRKGTLYVDPNRLLFPGDLLHEAGHLATIPPALRAELDGDLPDTDLHRGAELMTLAWSYAACVHLGIAVDVVFHKDGYKGEHEYLINLFQNGNYIGLPMLQYYRMAFDQKNASELNIQAFPHMVNWLCLGTEDA